MGQQEALDLLLEAGTTRNPEVLKLAIAKAQQVDLPPEEIGRMNLLLKRITCMKQQDAPNLESKSSHPATRAGWGMRAIIPATFPVASAAAVSVLQEQGHAMQKHGTR